VKELESQLKKLKLNDIKRKAEVLQIEVHKFAAEEKAKKEAAAAITNLGNVAQNKVTEFTVSPTQPLVTTCISSYGCADQFSGLIKPGVTQEKSLSVTIIKELVSVAISLPPVVGELYDVYTLKKGKDPITGEALTPLSSALTAIGLLSGLASGKLAREAGDLALRKISKEYDFPLEEVEQIATKVFQEVDLEKIDTSTFGKLIDEIRVAVKGAKHAKFMAKGAVSSATIAKFSDRIDEDSIRHILDGKFDPNIERMVGGHRSGQVTRVAESGNKFGSSHTEFPESWSDDKILESAIKVLGNSSANRRIEGSVTVFESIIDGVMVRVVSDTQSNKIITSYPLY
jgi:hypothetical protein